MNSKFIVTSVSILSVMLIGGWWLYQSSDDIQSVSGMNDMSVMSSRQRRTQVSADLCTGSPRWIPTTGAMNRVSPPWECL